MGAVLFRRGPSLAHVSRYGRRSPLYYWLKARHDTVLHGTEGGQVSWAAVGELVAMAGILDGHGLPPTVRRMRKVWAAVKRDVAKARREAGKRVADPAPVLLPKAVAHAPSEARRSRAEVEAMLAAVDAKLAAKKLPIPEAIR